jgi:hypothetical protein
VLNPNGKAATQRTETIKRQIEALATSLYNLEEPDAELQYENLKRFRTDIQRGFIVSLHLAIEQLLRAILFDFLVKQNKKLKTKETISIADNLRSAELIHWCARLNLITPKQYDHLKELNRIRNVCSHNWILDAPRYKQIREKNSNKRVTDHVVTYKGRNLLDSKVFADEFVPTYGGLHIKLLFKVWRLQGKR